jgi:hypothetical protein
MIQQLLDLRELISTKIKTCLHKLKFVLWKNIYKYIFIY